MTPQDLLELANLAFDQIGADDQDALYRWYTISCRLQILSQYDFYSLLKEAHAYLQDNPPIEEESARAHLAIQDKLTMLLADLICAGKVVDD